MSISFGSQKSKSKPVIEPAAITPKQRTQLFTPIGNLLGFDYLQTGTTPLTTTYSGGYGWPGGLFQKGTPITKGGQPIYSFVPKDVTQEFAQIPMEGINRYRALLESAMANPYIPTLAENQLLENIMGQTSAQFAKRGLGISPIAASSVAGSIAPSLITMRQQQLANLFQGLGGELEIGQGLLQQREQDINALLTQRTQQMQGLLAFLEQMGFKRQLGQKTTSSGFNFGIGGSSGGGTTVNVGATASPGGGSAASTGGG